MLHSRAMKGRVVERLVGVLDSATRALGRENPKRLPKHLLTGRRGEDAAYFYLRRNGYVITARNWRSPRHRGELDLVGWDGDVLCFIEVKTRSTREVATAEAAVDEEKRGDLIAVARDYRRRAARNRTIRGALCRFDIVSIYFDTENGSPDITLFKNAFPMP
ncbi:MAG: YraN family protein [Terriglobales bacterium]